MCCMKALPLDGRIRVEDHVHSVSAGYNWVWHFGSAVATQASCAGVITIKYLDVVICALLVGLQLKLVEDQFNSVSLCCGKMPDTVLSTGVEVWPVWTVDLSNRVCDKMLASP